MKRSIKWESGVFEEIECVYRKAEENVQAGKLLEQLEKQALYEVRCNIGRIRAGDELLTPEQFDELSEMDKEEIIRLLGENGIKDVDMILDDYPHGKFQVCLEADYQKMTACVMFDILNRLEKLEISVNSSCPLFADCRLELQVLVGGRDGLMQWLMLISMLNPWLTVGVTSSDELVQISWNA